MNAIKLVLVTTAFAVSGAAMAGPSYTYADLGYIIGESSGNGAETEGLALRGSFGFAEVFHVGGEYIDGEVAGGKGSNTLAIDNNCNQNSSITRSCIPGDNSGYNVYFGFNPAMTENIDLVARIGYSDFENDIGLVDVPFAGLLDYGTIEETAIFLEIGSRAMVSENLEINAAVSLLSGEAEGTIRDGINIETIKEDFTRVQYRVGGEYYFTPAISLGLDASLANNGDNNANIHVRYSFGNN